MSAIISKTVAKVLKIIESSIVLYALSVEIFGVNRQMFSV